MNAEQLQEYRELAVRLSYFGLEGRAQSAITALLAEVERLESELQQAQAQLAQTVDVRKMSVGQLQVVRDAANNRLYEIYCADLDGQAATTPSA